MRRIRGQAGRILAVAALAVLWALAGPAFALPPGPDDETAEILQYGEEAYREGSLDDALESADAVLEESPADARAIDLLRRTRQAGGEDREAESSLREILKAHPSSAAARRALATVLAHRQPKEAEALLQASIEAGDADEESRVRLAELLAARGARKEAAEQLLALFGSYRAAQAPNARALRWVARGAALASTLPALQKEHVRAFAGEAQSLYQQAYRLDGKDPDLLVEWAGLYVRKWELAEARKVLKKALELNRHHALGHALLAATYLEDLYGGTGNYDRARAQLDLALMQNPTLYEAHVLRAELLVTDALFEDARKALDRALAARPRGPRALGDRIGILTLQGDEPGAKAAREAAGSLAPAARAEMLLYLTRLLDQRFRYNAAFGVAKEAVKTDPAFWPAYTQLGLQAMRVGDEKEARTYLEKAHAADPFDLYAYNLLKLLDYMDKSFTTYETKSFVVRVAKSELPWLKPYLDPLAERCWAELTKRYGLKETGRRKILLEVFGDLQDFSVRAVAHRFIPASGVTFARVVAIASPRALPPGAHTWGRVLWHELAHVATLERSEHHVPRWLTEGVSVFEESKGNPAWVREWDEMLIGALRRQRLLPILELDQGFSKPRFPHQVMLSYYQGGLICQFLEETYGFGAILKLLDGYRDNLSLPQNLRAATGLDPAGFDQAFLAYAQKRFEGVRYRPSFDLPFGLGRLRRAAKRAPTDLDAQVRYAFACCDLGRYADAEIAVGRVLALAPSSGDARLVDGRIALHRGHAEKAMALFAEALALGTRDPLSARLLRARYFAKPAARGSRTPRSARVAVRELEAARLLFPRRTATLGALVKLYGGLEEKAKVAELEEALLGLQPNDAALRLRVAERWLKAGKVQDARELVEQCIWIAPQWAQVHALRAICAAYARDAAAERDATAMFKRTNRGRKKAELAAKLKERLEKAHKAPAPGAAKPTAKEPAPRPAPEKRPPPNHTPRGPAVPF